jgi:hypothetical protein
MNFHTTVDHDAEEVTIVFDDSIVLKVYRLEDATYKFSNFSKIEDEGEELVEILKQMAIDLLTIN